MSDELTSGHGGDWSIARWGELEEAARTYMRASKATNTLRAYRADLADFTLWCAEHQLERLPASPETVAIYITALVGADARASTIQRRLSAISQAHQLAGHERSPTHAPVVRTTMARIRRTLGIAPNQK